VEIKILGTSLAFLHLTKNFVSLIVSIHLLNIAIYTCHQPCFSVNEGLKQPILWASVHFPSLEKANEYSL
jgi:hypothetical protein